MSVQRLSSSQCIFSLSDWTFMTNVYVKHHPEGTVSLADQHLSSSWRWELFHLTDYVVSSVTAGTIWLSPR